MKNLHISAVLALLVGMFAITAYPANDPVTVVGGASIIHKNSEFTIGGSPYNLDFVSIEWSVVLAYENFYTSISYDQSIKDAEVLDNTFNLNRSPPEFNNELLTGQREDFAITFGYSLYDGVTVFAGLKQGTTSGISGGQVRQFTNAPPPDNYLVEYTDYSIDESGPFIGASYSWDMGDASAVSLSAAYADLDGDIAFVRGELDDAGDIVFASEALAGKNTGFSYKISWTNALSEDLTLTIGVNIIRYRFDAPQAPGGDNLDFDNNFTNTSITFNKYF